MAVVNVVPQERNNEWRVEQKVNFPVSQSVEEIVEVMQITLPERKQRTAGAFPPLHWGAGCRFSVPHVVEQWRCVS